MEILVTGGKGFIGTHLCNYTNAQSVDIKDSMNCIDLKLDYLSKFTTVIHCAASKDVEESNVNKSKYVYDNIYTTTKLLELCEQAGVKYFINFSSAAAKDPEKSFYGRTKKIIEDILPDFNIKWINIRPYNIFGPGDTFSVIYKFLTSDIIMHGDGSQTRDFVYISDFCDMMNYLIANIDSYLYDTIDFCTGKSTSILEIAKICAKIKQQKTITMRFDKNKGIQSSYGDPSLYKKAAQISNIYDNINKFYEYL